MNYTAVSRDGWEYVFFDAGNGLTMAERITIADSIIDCYQKGDKTSDIQSDTFEARIKRGNVGNLGAIIGVGYSAEVVPNPINGTERPRTNLSILVLDKVEPSRN